MKKPTERGARRGGARVIGIRSGAAGPALRSIANRPALRVLGPKPAARERTRRLKIAAAPPRMATVAIAAPVPVIAKSVATFARIDRAAAALALLAMIAAVVLLTAKPEGWSRGPVQSLALARMESSPAIAQAPAALTGAPASPEAAAMAPAPSSLAAASAAAALVPEMPEQDAAVYDRPQSFDAVPSEPLAAVAGPDAEIALADLPTDLIPAITEESEDLAGRERRCELDDYPAATDASLLLSGVSNADASATDFGLALAKAALAQTREFVVYTDRYKRLKFPLGDVSALFGVCTDVIIRAYRAVGVDLQSLVNKAGVGSGDPNIDHRRTEVLRRFFAGNGRSFTPSDVPDDYFPGDVVSYHRPQNSGSQSHIAIVSNIIGVSGRPLIVHNRGWGPQLEDALFVDQITGHYRYAGPSSAASNTGALLRARNKKLGVLRHAAAQSVAPAKAKSFVKRRAAMRTRLFKSSVAKAARRSSPGKTGVTAAAAATPGS